MKKKTLKILTLLIIAILCASVLFACNEKDSSSGAWASITEDTKPEDIKSDIVSEEEWDACVNLFAEQSYVQLLQESKTISSFSCKTTFHLLDINNVSISKYTKDAFFGQTITGSKEGYRQAGVYLLLEKTPEGNDYTLVSMTEDGKWVKNDRLKEQMSISLNTPIFAQYKDYFTMDNFHYDEETGAYQGIILLKDEEEYEEQMNVELRIVASFPVYIKVWNSDDEYDGYVEYFFYDINNTTVEVPDYEE